VSVPKRRYLFDRLLGGLIRVTSLLVGLGVVGMFLQMTLVVWPMFEPLSVKGAGEDHKPQRPVSSPLERRSPARGQPTRELRVQLPDFAGDIVLSEEGGLLLAELRPPDTPEKAGHRHVFPPSIVFSNVSIAGVDPAGEKLLLASRTGKYWLFNIDGSPPFQEIDSGEVVPHQGAFPAPGLQSWVLATENGLEQVHLVFEGGQAVLSRLRGIEVPSGIRHVSEISLDRQLLAVGNSGNVYHWQLADAEPILLTSVGGNAMTVSWLSPSIFQVGYADGRSASFEIKGQSRQLLARQLFMPVHYEGYQSAGYFWQPSATSNGFESKQSLVPLLAGTLKAAVVALLLAIPISVGAAIYVGYFLSSRRREQIKPLIEVIASFPSVVVAGLAAIWLAPRLIDSVPEITGAALAIPVAGLLGLVFLRTVPSWSRSIDEIRVLPIRLIPLLVVLILIGATMGHLLERLLPEGSLVLWLAQQGISAQQLNSVLVGVILGFAIIPTIFSLAEEAVYEVPRIGATGSIALGATPWRSFRDVVLPTAAPGIISAIMLGFGRATGETMIFLLLSGNAPGTDWNLFASVRSLSATLAIELPEAAVGSMHFRVLFLGALLLFVLTFTVNTLGHLIRRRMFSKYRLQR